MFCIQELNPCLKIVYISCILSISESNFYPIQSPFSTQYSYNLVVLFIYLVYNVLKPRVRESFCKVSAKFVPATYNIRNTLQTSVNCRCWFLHNFLHKVFSWIFPVLCFINNHFPNINIRRFPKGINKIYHTLRILK